MLRPWQGSQLDAISHPELASHKNMVAERLKELATSVAEVAPAILAKYDKARRTDKECLGQQVHCSMKMEIGTALHPQTVEEICRTYIRAVERLRRDPQFAGGISIVEMRKFWAEFSKTVLA